MAIQDIPDKKKLLLLRLQQRHVVWIMITYLYFQRQTQLPLNIVANVHGDENDCYNEVVYRKEGLGIVRNSWLRRGLEYISHGDALPENTLEDVEAASTTELLSQKSLEWKSEIETEILGLKCQLLQIKKGLWPAATFASEQNNDDVTPKQIFEEARRATDI